MNTLHYCGQVFLYSLYASTFKCFDHYTAWFMKYIFLIYFGFCQCIGYTNFGDIQALALKINSKQPNTPYF